MNLVEALNKGKKIKEENIELSDNLIEELKEIMKTFEEFNHLYQGSIYKEIYDTFNNYIREYSSI